MNKRTLFPLLALTQTAAFAGEATVVVEEKEPWYKFSVEARARIEVRNQQGFDNSWAGTFRIRPGFQVGKDEGFAAFVQTEHTLAFIDDYNAGPQAGLTPSDPSQTSIFDPENNELNQLYGQYKGFGGLTRVGRQRIIFDNAAFIGNVGWRQNEQTFDAALLDYDIAGFKVKYSYMNRVNRIFGTDAVGGAKALEGDAHLINASYDVSGTPVTGYVYLMDFDERNYNSLGANNNTYGIFTDLTGDFGKLHLEGAYQTEAGDKADYEALYAHLIYSKKVNSFTYSFGTEYLEEGFVTPLATVHKFNGWADVFIGDRLGLSSVGEGITDVYAGVATKLDCGLALKSNLHAFFDDGVSDFYGWEIDALAVKPITKDIKAIAKFAHYFADDGTAFADDVTQFSAELNYTF